MLSTPNRRPIFVYGTLQPGNHNYDHYLAGRTTDEIPATATGLALYDGPFPYAIPCPCSTVTGTLIELAAQTRNDVLKALDALEGYYPDNLNRSHYTRVTWPVTATTTIAGGRTFQTYHLSYLYIASPNIDLTGRQLIPNGTWEPKACKT